MLINQSKKKLGVIGGMGTRATWKFCEMITDAFGAEKEWDHPPMVVFLATQTPSRTRALLYGEESPVKYLVSGCRDLGSLGANLIAIPCNSSHFWHSEVSDEIKNENLIWLNMIELVKQDVPMEDTLVVGGYAVMEKKLYGPDPIYPVEEYDEVALMLEELRRGKEVSDRKLFDRLVGIYRPKRILMACTELSLLPGLSMPCETYDSSLIYARKIVELMA